MVTPRRLKHRSLSQYLSPTTLYGLVGIVCTTIPITLVLQPLVLFFLIPYVLSSLNEEQYRRIFSSIVKRVLIIHLLLAVFPFFLKYDLFFKLLASGWHLITALFWALYLVSYGQEHIGKRIRLFLLWTAGCFVVAWAAVGVDTFLLGGVAKQSLLQQIQIQAAQLRDALFQSKISPYQLPHSIQLLLEQGVQPWTQIIIQQVVPALFGLSVTTFFVYWNLFDIRGKNPSGPVFLFFKLPDWSMVILVAWLTLWLTGYSLKQPMVHLPVQGLPLELIAEIGWAGLFATLWWYALEGVSILIRLGARFKRFWVYFALTLLLFFNVEVAEVLLMGIGLGAQIRRFVPVQQKKA